MLRSSAGTAAGADAAAAEASCTAAAATASAAAAAERSSERNFRGGGPGRCGGPYRWNWKSAETSPPRRTQRYHERRFGTKLSIVARNRSEGKGAFNVLDEELVLALPAWPLCEPTGNKNKTEQGTVT